jgi:purine-binding chemotaxis protein CheW
MSAEASLLCSVGVRYCSIPLARVIETMRRLPVAPIPGAPAFVDGVAIVRGVPLPVVSMFRLMEMQETEEAADATSRRFVSVRVGDRRAVLAVDSVLGVRHLPASSKHELPPLLRGAAAGIVAHVGALDAQLLLVLSTINLVPESLWRSVG